MRAGHTCLIAVLACISHQPAAADADLEPDEDCVTCHSDVVVPDSSAHAGLACADCHTGLNVEEIPHAAVMRPPQCSACHDGLASTHAFHAALFTDEGGSMIDCAECHGSHDVKLLDDDSPFRPDRLAAACGECHAEIADDFSRSEHGRALSRGEAGAPSCLGCHEQPLTVARANGDLAGLKRLQARMCLSCHLDNPEIRARMGPDAGFIAAYERSVHGAALAAGNAEAATCTDCHGSHEMKRGMDPDAHVSKAHIPETCARCHETIAREYNESTHAEALRRGIADAPVCTDCHGEHDILLHTDPRSPVAAANVSAQVCSPCHSSVKLAEKYGIASDRFKTFSDSYHGLALRGGSLEVANCASCHGAHAIKPSSDPTSSTNKANLATTCGRCHPGANERFAVGLVHVARDSEEEPVLYWIATIYVVLIVATIGTMFVHNAADFSRRAARRWRIRRGTLAEPSGGALHVRMTLSERLQHGLLMVSFVLLVVTGFMLSYPDAWWVRLIRGVSDSAFEMRSLIHRCAAAMMVVVALYHFFYVALTKRGRALVRDFLPGRKDIADGVAMVRYNLRLSETRPRFGRFAYPEKIEYWALIWGTILMVSTGVIMWFENTSIGLLTKLGWDIARSIHFYEAWLATLAILVWHIYYVVINPDVYPMTTTWLTGHMTEAEMAEEHPLELADLTARPEKRKSDD